jgi:hypothetical protein
MNGAVAMIAVIIVSFLSDLLPAATPLHRGRGGRIANRRE